MLDSFLKFCLCQQLFAFKNFGMETSFRNISKNTNATDFIKTILESSHKGLLEICNLMAPKRSVFLLNAFEF